MLRSFTTLLLLVGLAISLAYLVGSCRKQEGREELNWMEQSIPQGFPQPLYYFQGNPLSEEGFELGRKLFYDGILSLDGNFPCSSCHQQIGAFGTYEHDRSHGYNGSHTLRNAPALFNLAWQKQFHWDGEFDSFLREAEQPITGHIEMAESFSGVIRKLQADPEYREMFRRVFRTPHIRPELVLKALAQFTGNIVSGNSKYDRYLRGEASFTAQEMNGYQLFQANCASCHPAPLFTDNTFHNIGLPVDDHLEDFGRMRITNNSADSLLFKTPTLRNVYISSNYMHDGRFNTLAQCINHYRSGVQQGPTLDPLLINGIELTNSEVTDLALFLRALTDSSIITNPRYRPE